MPRSSRAARASSGAPTDRAVRLELSQHALTSALLTNQEAVTGRVSEIVDGFRGEVLHEIEQLMIRFEAQEREISEIRKVLGMPPRELGA